MNYDRENGYKYTVERREKNQELGRLVFERRFIIVCGGISLE